MILATKRSGNQQQSNHAFSSAKQTAVKDYLEAVQREIGRAPTPQEHPDEIRLRQRLGFWKKVRVNENKLREDEEQEEEDEEQEEEEEENFASVIHYSPSVELLGGESQMQRKLIWRFKA